MIILCDLDHVIANSFWRDPMIGGEGGWDAYHEASKDDKPVKEIKDMLNGLHNQGYYIICITARPEKWRKLSLCWFIKHDVMIDEILMRPDDAFHPVPEIKLELVKLRFPTEEAMKSIAFIMDDREDIIEAFRGLGITALQVHARAK